VQSEIVARHPPSAPVVASGRIRPELEYTVTPSSGLLDSSVIRPEMSYENGTPGGWQLVWAKASDGHQRAARAAAKNGTKQISICEIRRLDAVLDCLSSGFPGQGWRQSRYMKYGGSTPFSTA